MFRDIRVITCSFCKIHICRVEVPPPWAGVFHMPGNWKIRTDKESNIDYYWCGECELPEEQKKYLKEKNVNFPKKKIG